MRIASATAKTNSCRFLQVQNSQARLELRAQDVMLSKAKHLVP
jgi:hypothetical protein